MKKKQFRVQLFENSSKTAQAVILAAAQSNSGYKPVSISELAEYGRAYSQKADLLNNQCEVIGENTLHIDAPVNGNYETVAIVEQVEVFEPVRDYDDDDFKTDILAGSKYPETH